MVNFNFLGNPNWELLVGKMLSVNPDWKKLASKGNLKFSPDCKKKIVDMKFSRRNV